MRPDEVRRNQFFAEILKRESCRCLGEDGFFEENLLSNPYPEVRQWCAIALGRIANRRALPWLYTALYRGESALRAASAFAIGEIEDRQFLGDQHLPIDPRAPLELVRLLDDPSLFVQMRAVEALGKIGSQAESAEIAKRLERYPYKGSPTERANLDVSIAALARMGDPQAIPALKKMAATRDPEIEWRAVDALVRLRDKTARSLFITLLNSEDPVVRSYAARGIGITEDPNLASLLLPLLPRQEPSGKPIPLIVRICALQALGDLKNPSAMPAIRNALRADPIDDAHPDQQNFAIQAASTIGSIGVVEGEAVLLPLLECSGPVANHAVVALAKILREKPERFFGLIDKNRFVDPDASRAWARSMAELSATDAAAELNKILEPALAHVSSQTELIADILASLAKIEAPGLQEILRPLFAFHDPVLLRAAVEAYRAKPGIRDPWAPVIQAFAATASSSNVEARIAILNHLKPWVHEKAVQQVLRSGVKDRERSIRLISAGLLRLSGVTDIADDSTSSNDPQTDAVCFALAANRRKDTIAILETTRGTIEVKLFREDAPVTVANFVSLANRGSYDGLEFYRADPASLIEVKDPPNPAAAGHASFTEINLQSFTRGSLGMALAGLDSQTNRFFITATPQPGLDGSNTCFGRVISGMAIVDRTVPGDRLKRIRIKEIRSLFSRQQ